MFRAGALICLAIFLIAAVPIPIPKPSITAEQQRPEHGIRGQREPTNRDGTPQNPALPIPPKIISKSNDSSATEKVDKHDSGRVEWPSWIEAFGALATAAFIDLTIASLSS
jgi:hypothetical protein